MEFDNQINEILMRYSDNNDNFYAFETIPEKKLINALQYYQIPDDVSVYALLDTTVFGSAKTGLAITPYGIYWRNGSGIGNEVEAIDWVELNQLLPTISFSKYAIVFKPNVELDVSGSTMKQEAIIALFSELAPLFNQLIDDVNQDYKIQAVTELLPQTLAMMAMNDAEIDNNLVGQAISAVQSVSRVDHAAIFSELSTKLQHYLALGQQSMALIQIEQATLLAKWQSLDTEQKKVLKNSLQMLQPQSTLAQQWKQRLLQMH